MSTVSIYREMESSPTVVLYGDGGDHEMILRDIDGWYGSPESKVQLSERAYGNGAHDIASEDIDYGARTVMVDWRIIANGRDGMLAALHAIRTLAGHTVRIRVVDGMDDLYAVGYVHEAGKDKSAQNIPQQTETGTLTIVCQRPEILSWSPLQTQLFPASVMQGGLRYSTVRRLVSAWLGKANASTSTLSQDGQVVATNLFPTPRPESADMGNTSITQTADGFTIMTNKTYTGSGDDHNFYPKDVVAGSLYHLHAETDDVLTTTLPDLSVGIDLRWENGISFPSTHLSSPSVIDMDFLPTHAINRITFKCGMTAGDHVTWRRIGLYTATDWQVMQALGVDWFSGDSYPVPTGKGLSYGPDGRGLSYGVSAGGERNLAILSNHGTTNAYPTLTVTGPFPNGVEIQTGVGGVIRYTGAIGMVPLVIQCDPRNVAASMGGVDVGRYLTGRDLPSIPACGSMSLRLMSAGSGWVTVTVRDTYL